MPPPEHIPTPAELEQEAAAKKIAEQEAIKAAKTTEEENVCCGTSSVDWHNFYSEGSFLDINTGTCKFSETPKYFTSLVGNAYIDRVQGASSIYSPTSSGSLANPRSCPVAARCRHKA